MKRRSSWESPGLKDRGHHRRILLIMLLLGAAAFVPVILQLYRLMILEFDYYASLALRNQTRTTLVTADRGIIYDRDMHILADSVTTENVYLDPRELQQAKIDLHALSADLGGILKKDPQWIEKLGKDRTRRYQQIAAGVEAETGDALRDYIREKQIYGVHLEPSVRRTYPFGSLASQVIGFTDASNQGVEGIELSYDSYLRGKPGKVITTKGNNEMDMPFSFERFGKTDGGCSVVLTLDTGVQQCLEKHLQAAMDRYRVKNGSFGLVMNCKTGEILAMTTLPGFDPNAYQQIGDPQKARELEGLKQAYESCPKDSPQYAQGKKAYGKALKEAQLRQWRNRVISDGYEPGSTFKVMTMAAALDTGAIDLNTDFYCAGAEQIPGRAQLLHCWRHQGHGSEKTPQALQNSCNIAFAHIALKLGGRRFYEYIQKFGILEKTGIDLRGESRGIFFDRALIENTEKWGTASLTSGSFGQTFKLTPIQLVRAIGSVVNGGILMEPYLVSEVLDAEGNPVLRQTPTAIRRTISEETSRTMRELLRSVVTEGTARNAAVAGFSVGGKTGTSEKIDVFDENGRRVLDKIVSFVGIAPMDDPEYIVLAALDTPSRDCGTYLSGGAMAAPTVGGILRELLPYLGVSREPGSEIPVSVPDFTGLTAPAAQTEARKLGLSLRLSGEEEYVTAQLPRAGETACKGSEVLLYLGEEPENRLVTVPDFTGMNRQQAAEAAGKAGLFLIPQGNLEISPGVTVIAQNIEPEKPVPSGTTVTLEFTDKTVPE